MAEAWALGMRRVEWRGQSLERIGEDVRRVNARAPSSPAVVRRVLVGERGVVVMDLMAFWWRGIRMRQVRVDDGVFMVSEGL